jgi:hypothetical protein
MSPQQPRPTHSAESLATLSPEALHNALHSMTVAYGGAIADQKRIARILQTQLDQLGEELERTRKLLAEAQKAAEYMSLAHRGANIVADEFKGKIQHIVRGLKKTTSFGKTQEYVILSRACGVED